MAYKVGHPPLTSMKFLKSAGLYSTVEELHSCEFYQYAKQTRLSFLQAILLVLNFLNLFIPMFGGCIDLKHMVTAPIS